MTSSLERTECRGFKLIPPEGAHFLWVVSRGVVVLCCIAFLCCLIVYHVHVHVHVSLSTVVLSI